MRHSQREQAGGGYDRTIGTAARPLPYRPFSGDSSTLLIIQGWWLHVLWNGSATCRPPMPARRTGHYLACGVRVVVVERRPSVVFRSHDSDSAALVGDMPEHAIASALSVEQVISFKDIAVVPFMVRCRNEGQEFCHEETVEGLIGIVRVAVRFMVRGEL